MLTAEQKAHVLRLMAARAKKRRKYFLDAIRDVNTKFTLTPSNGVLTPRPKRKRKRYKLPEIPCLECKEPLRRKHHCQRIHTKCLKKRKQKHYHTYHARLQKKQKALNENVKCYT